MMCYNNTWKIKLFLISQKNNIYFFLNYINSTCVYKIYSEGHEWMKAMKTEERGKYTISVRRQW